MSISGIYAIGNSTDSATFRTGVIDIKLQNYKLNSENQEEEYNETNTIVAPGEIISFIPKVYNEGESCYLRIKVFYMNDNIDFRQYVTGFSSQFIKIGEYYYYQGIVDAKESIKLFDTLKMPDDNDEFNISNTIALKITAEAIQSKNYSPDYTSDDPWNGIEPEGRIDTSYDIDTDDENAIIIKYENGTENDITVPSNIFNNINTVMPGDSFNESVKLKNNKAYTRKYFLQLGLNQNTNKEVELLNKIKVEITNSIGQTIYSGALSCEEKILLGEYDSNQSDEFIFNFTVSPDIKNDFVLLKPELLWIFSSEDKNEQEEQKTEEKKEEKKSQAKTSDTIDIAFTVFLISSICLTITIILGYIEKKKNID